MNNFRYLENFIKYVEAIHIFSSDRISNEQLNKGKLLLDSFVKEFEELYGRANMVFNVHLSHHIYDCVKKNGPQYAYSTYNMEDHNGYLVSKVHGTSDVIKQVTQKYMLEYHLKLKINNSVRAKEFFDKIQSFQLKRNKILKQSNLSTDDYVYIRNTIGNVPILEYENIYLNGNFYRVKGNGVKKINSNDSFILTKGGEIGEIKSIFTPDDKSIFLLVCQKYELLDENNIQCIKFLKEISNRTYIIIKLEDIGKKAVFMQYENVTAFSTLPNNYERD